MEPTPEFLAEVRQQVEAAARELVAVAGLRPGQILVVGCSTSEVCGERIGTAGSLAVADAVVRPLLAVCREHGLYLAAQCCEHLNRALVVTRECAERYGLEEVTVVPVPGAGGAFASRAMALQPEAICVEDLRGQAHAGLDIGQTLIGMHLRRVAVPVRLGVRQVGRAVLTAARTRPKLIGGERAVYRRDRLPPLETGADGPC
ncbi:MAG: TIGR01440 family protein [Bacillota bacterium]|nr:MAG: TIGR01440 family protein [Bacillota bacterium]